MKQSELHEFVKENEPNICQIVVDRLTRLPRWTERLDGGVQLSDSLSSYSVGHSLSRHQNENRGLCQPVSF